MTKQSAHTLLVILRAALARVDELKSLVPVDDPERPHVLVALKELYAVAGPSSSWVVAATQGHSVPGRVRSAEIRDPGPRGGHVRQCPECMADLVRVDGCTKCPACGWLGSCG